jgi:hypothetical protein
MRGPLCEACGDEGLQTLAPLFRGALEREGGDCEHCPRCAVCELRLAEAPDRALVLTGWDSYCGLPHLSEAMLRRPAGERALYALDLLADPPLSRADLADLLGMARSYLAELTRGLLASGADLGSAALTIDAGTLRSLAAVSPDVPVVTEMCVECDRVAARRLDLSARSGDAAVWSLCEAHARLEAESIRRSQRRLAREASVESSAQTPQLQLPLRPAMKKVRRASAAALKQTR